MMKMNLRYRVLLILLVSGMTCIPSFAQVREYPQQDISFTEYLNRVGKSNLVYLAGNNPSMVVTEVIRIGRKRCRAPSNTDWRADAADFFFEAILQRELLGVQNRSYQYMLQLSQSDSLRYAAGEITENDARQSKLEAMTLLNAVYTQEAAYQSALVMLNRTWELRLIH